MSDEKENNQLKVEVIDGELQIKIGINILVFATTEGGENPFDDVGMKVNDLEEFQKDIVRQLSFESENGTTVVHSMLDKAVYDMFCDGSMAFPAEETDSNCDHTPEPHMHSWRCSKCLVWIKETP